MKARKEPLRREVAGGRDDGGEHKNRWFVLVVVDLVVRWSRGADS